jgi:ABC-type uncharacterized transport system auxiliary subunit
MSSRERRCASLALAAASWAAALAGSGCTGSLFQSKEPAHSVYLLSVTPAPGGADIAADITLLRPRLRPGLDTTLIAALYSDRRLDHFAHARWSGPLDEVVQDLALQAFRADAHARNVHTDVSSFGTGYWLEIDVVDFQAEYSGAESAVAGSNPPTIHVHLVARLGASGDRHVVGEFEADVRQAATTNGLSAIIDAYNRAAADALAKIVAQTGQALPHEGQPRS